LAYIVRTADRILPVNNPSTWFRLPEFIRFELRYREPSRKLDHEQFL